MANIKPPNHLDATTKKWFRSVISEFDLEAHHVRLLTLAAESWDRCQQARKLIAKHGLIYTDRLDVPRARPEVSIERDSRIAFARLIRELGLDSVPDEHRPPRTR